MHMSLPYKEETFGKANNGPSFRDCLDASLLQQKFVCYTREH